MADEVQLVGTDESYVGTLYGKDLVLAQQYTVQLSGELTEIRAYVAGECGLKAGIYNESYLKLASNDAGISATAGWNSVAVGGIDISQNDIVWLAVLVDTNSMICRGSENSVPYSGTSCNYADGMPDEILEPQYTTRRILIQGWGTLASGGAGRLIGSGDPSMIHVAHPKMIHVANPSLIRARGG